MKLAILDDETVQIDLLEKMIHSYEKTIEIVTYNNAESMLWDISDGLEVDAFLLDIQMAKMTGMQAAHEIRDRHIEAPICFITGVKDYVFEGYDVNAIGYILKPFEQDQIERILQKISTLCQKEEKTICISKDGEIIRLKESDVVALEASGHETILYQKGNRNIVLHAGIQEALSLFPNDLFCKIHRSYAVNLHHIVKIGKDACVDENQRTYPIARGNRTMVMRKFMFANKDHML